MGPSECSNGGGGVPRSGRDDRLIQGQHDKPPTPLPLLPPCVVNPFQITDACAGCKRVSDVKLCQLRRRRRRQWQGQQQQ